MQRAQSALFPLSQGTTPNKRSSLSPNSGLVTEMAILSVNAYFLHQYVSEFSHQSVELNVYWPFLSYSQT